MRGRPAYNLRAESAAGQAEASAGAQASAEADGSGRSATSAPEEIGMSTSQASLERIFPPNAPTPRGPYSPAVRAGDFIYVSGQGPIDPLTDKLSNGDIQHETRLVLSNIKRILEACGASMADVVKCSVFLKDGSEFKAM